MTPCMSSMRRLASMRPMPEPSMLLPSWPSRLKDWKSRAIWLGSNPAPVSRMVTRTRPGALTAYFTSTNPSLVLYLMALVSKLISTCFTRVRSARTKSGTLGAMGNRKRMPSC
eukprot:Mycagemm_TRINITY_DN10294_c0_g2::TRINITY_DN10294_c0_g2_i1::g.3664::m.3664 type:complete len:113 gc:universal TRINITY_DN10294_c0_g2_i1:535-197(-)